MKTKNAKSAFKLARQLYYAKQRAQYCADMRRRYDLAQPKSYVQYKYINKVSKKIFSSKTIISVLKQSFQQNNESIAKEMSSVMCKKAVATIAAKRLVNKVLQLRKHYAGSLLGAIRSINKLNIANKDDFGEGLHSALSEPYFYEAAYNFVDRPDVMSIDEFGISRHLCEPHAGDNDTCSWKCSSKCKPLTDNMVSIISNFKSGFNVEIKEVRKLLDKCDKSCPYTHYHKLVDIADEDPDCKITSMQRKGHSSLCFTDDECNSQLRILRAASTHFSVLRSFLRALYKAIGSPKHVADLDALLHQGHFASLMKACAIDSYDTLFSNDMLCTESVSDGDSPLRKSNLEYELQITHAKLMVLYDKAVHDYHTHPCCSCNMLFQKKCVSVVKLDDDLGGKVWPVLKQHILSEDGAAANKSFFMCHYCKGAIRKDKMPPRCVLNGLEVVVVPQELANLDCLSRQFIQRAKAYQTVVRLGTYTNKVPVYNSLKACKGNMFFLPLPLHKTMATLENVNECDEEREVSLASPELYIIVNCKPTKNKVVWRSLVYVDKIKVALNKLKEINWLYKAVDDSSIDETSKEVIEVVSKASSTMLERATEDDVAGFQYYTIKNLDSKLSTESDIDQYKLLDIKEDPLDNRQKHLDVMCFPVLFPDGHFGKYQPRQVKLNDSEYIKSRLLNKDSRFRKDPRYIFFLLWQKEMKEIACGVYNALKTSKSMPMSVANLLQKVHVNDEHLETNLNTMFQSVRGTKHWFLRQSELQSVILARLLFSHI